MCKKSKIRCGGLIYLASFVLVAGLVLTGEGYAGYSTDESLILYLPLDEGQGSIVMDASSFKNEGAIVGGAAWVEGNIGMALEIVDGSHVLIPEIPEYDVTSAVTLMTWMKDYHRNDLGQTDRQVSVAE